MTTLLMILALHHLQWGLDASWFKPPLTHVVLPEQRYLQIETGLPIKAIRRGRAEVLLAALHS